MRLISISLLLACSSILPAKSHVAERYDVRVQILPDASLRVFETVRFRFRGGAYSFVSRELRKGGTDRIFEIDARMDGGPVRTDVHDTGSVVKVVWHFDAAADSSHEFTLAYGVSGAIRKEPERDVLQWRAIPDRHDYTILAGQIEVEYPERSGLEGLPEAPHAISAKHEPTISIFTLPELPRDHGAPVWVQFRPGFAPQPPRWQTAEQDRGARATRAWRAGIIAALIAGAIGMVWLLGLYRSIAPNASIPDLAGDASDTALSMAPALVARLARAGTRIHRHLGTLFDLARRGAVSIREGERRRFGGRKYQVEARDLRQLMLPFESAVLKLAFGDDKAPPPRDFSSFVNKLSTSGGAVEKMLKQHMVSLGLLDPERMGLARRWQVSGLLATVVGLAAGGLGFAVTVAAVGSGPAGAVPAFATLAGVGAAAFLIGVVGLILSSNISPLTLTGAQRAASCRSLRQRLAAVADGRDNASPDEFERWLPFALAFGTASAWVKRFRKEGQVSLPPWFAVGEDSLDSFAFFDFVASSSASADASASAGADGGGSRGGSSSAG